MNSRDELFAVFSPLVLALHDKRVIDIAELPHYYEDVLARRTIDRGESPEQTQFLREVIDGLHRLARQVKDAEKNQPK